MAAWLARNVLAQDQGPEEMRQIASMIYEGAIAFLNRQYRTIVVLALIAALLVAALLAWLSGGRAEVGPLELAWRTGLAFIIGAASSGIAGFIGMIVAVKANVRTAAAAQRNVGEAVTIALQGGAVSGILVVALSLIGVFALFYAYGGLDNPQHAPGLIIGYGFETRTTFFYSFQNIFFSLLFKI